jgi:hypothetical protein
MGLMASAAEAEEYQPPDPAADLFVRRVTRLEQVSIQIRHILHDHTQALIAEKLAKSELYLNNARDTSHGAKEGYASAMAVNNVVESVKLKGELDSLVEERDFLRFVIEFDAGF